MYRLSAYIGSFQILHALRASMTHPDHVESFPDMQTRLLNCIDEAKRQYEAGGNDDKNLYGLIVGAESAIKAANETIKADGKGYCYSLV